MGRVSHKTEVINLVLDGLMFSGIIGASLVAPNIMKVMGDGYLKHMEKRDKAREVQALLRYMHRKAIISIVEINDLFEITITEKGKLRVLKASFDDLKINTPNKWDQKWRIVIFDVPELFATARRALSDKLRDVGFILLQKSVWVHPFPCQEQIELIKHVYPEIKPYVIYIEATEVDDHNTLVKRFSKILNLTP